MILTELKLRPSNVGVARRVAVFLLPIRGSSRRLDGFRLAIWPLMIFALTILIAAVAGVARESGCQGLRSFLGSLLLRRENSIACRAVPFLVDIPTVILAFTAPFAAVAYLTILRKLESLVADLQSSGLIANDRRAEVLQTHISRNLARYPPSGVVAACLFVLSVIMTTWLYSRNLQSGGIFETLSTSAASAEQLRGAWWANYRSHPILAVYCIAVGAIGVHYALCSAWVYGLTARILAIKGLRLTFHHSIQYVPKWKDKSHGWAPLTSLVMIVYASAINFAVSMIAVFDMLHAGSINRLTASFFGTLGLVTDLAIVIGTLTLIMQGHKRVGIAVRRRIESELRIEQRRSGRRQPRRSGKSSDELVLAARDVESWRLLPIANPFVGVLKVLPGIYAIVQFSRSLQIF